MLILYSLEKTKFFRWQANKHGRRDNIVFSKESVTDNT